MPELALALSPASGMPSNLEEPQWCGKDSHVVGYRSDPGPERCLALVSGLSSAATRHLTISGHLTIS
jgi:hypothetical protein